MKKSVKLVLSSLILVSLTGCPLNITYSPNNGGNNSTNSSKDSSSLSNNQSSSSTSFITNSNNSSTSSNNSSTSFDNKEIILDLYASNDIHGRISENINEDEPGIAKLATYLNNRKNEIKMDIFI